MILSSFDYAPAYRGFVLVDGYAICRASDEGLFRAIWQEIGVGHDGFHHHYDEENSTNCSSPQEVPVSPLHRPARPIAQESNHRKQSDTTQHADDPKAHQYAYKRKVEPDGLCLACTARNIVHIIRYAHFFTPSLVIGVSRNETVLTIIDTTLL